jgi:hypothetical protein
MGEGFICPLYDSGLRTSWDLDTDVKSTKVHV